MRCRFCRDRTPSTGQVVHLSGWKTSHPPVATPPPCSTNTDRGGGPLPPGFHLLFHPPLPGGTRTLSHWTPTFVEPRSVDGGVNDEFGRGRTVRLCGRDRGETDETQGPGEEGPRKGLWVGPMYSHLNGSRGVPNMVCVPKGIQRNQSEVGHFVCIGNLGKTSTPLTPGFSDSPLHRRGINPVETH